MKFSQVVIKQKAFEPGEWWVTFEDLPDDRVPGKGSLHPLGVYNYPTKKMGREKALEKLKKYMLKLHQDEIGRLEKSMESIRRIRMPVVRKGKTS